MKVRAIVRFSSSSFGNMEPGYVFDAPDGIARGMIARGLVEDVNPKTFPNFQTKPEPVAVEIKPEPAQVVQTKPVTNDSFMGKRRGRPPKVKSDDYNG